MAPRGGGLDIDANKHLSLRLGEVDYLLTDFREVPVADRKVENNLRVRLFCCMFTGLKIYAAVAT